MSAPSFKKEPSLKYLGLPQDFTPSPEDDPVGFLSQFLSQLPPHILVQYNTVTTPKQRTVMSPIRNRRLHYTLRSPPELQFERARSTWPELWQGRERRGIEEGDDERTWAQQDFLRGNQQHVGKLGKLLGDYEEEREAERVRELRRTRVPVEDDFIPEEESDDEEDDNAAIVLEADDPQQAKATFERLIRERFIYGLLDRIDYDKVDWDESLDVENDRETEERWFDEEEEE